MKAYFNKDKALTSFCPNSILKYNNAQKIAH